MINLLPPQEKNNIYNLLLKRQLHVFVFIITIIFFGGAIFVLNTLVFLKIQVGELGQSLNLESTTVEADSVKSLEDKAKDLNFKLAKYQSFRDGSAGLSTILVRVSDVVPLGVGLTALNVDTATRKVTMSGQAQTRDDIVSMENKIKKSEYFEKIESPLSNYLQKNNATFNLSFYFK